MGATNYFRWAAFGVVSADYILLIEAAQPAVHSNRTKSSACAPGSVLVSNDDSNSRGFLVLLTIYVVCCAVWARRGLGESIMLT